MPDGLSADKKPLRKNGLHSLYQIKDIAASCLDQLKKESDSNPRDLLRKANAALSQTMQQARRVIEMIHHFRSLDSPVRSGEDRETSIRDSVFQVLRAMQYEFPLHHITVLKILPHDLPPVSLAPEHLEAVLFQLVYNARQAIGAGEGIITVEAAEKIYLSKENKTSSRLALRVSDTGEKIPEDSLPHLFDPFFTNEEGEPASGLGLYLVKKIMDYYSGTIRVETSPNGTSFYLEFPRRGKDEA